MRRVLALLSVILFSLVVACNGSVQPTNAQASSSSGAASSGSGMTCDQCTELVFTTGSACSADLTKCQGDKDCGAWLACTNNCDKQMPTLACFQDCDAKSGGAKALYDPLYMCVCGACAAECYGACK